MHKHIFPYIVLSNSDNSTLNKSRFYYFEIFWENKRNLGDGCLCSRTKWWLTSLWAGQGLLKGRWLGSRENIWSMELIGSDICSRDECTDGIDILWTSICIHAATWFKARLLGEPQGESFHCTGRLSYKALFIKAQDSFYQGDRVCTSPSPLRFSVSGIF